MVNACKNFNLHRRLSKPIRIYGLILLLFILGTKISFGSQFYAQTTQLSVSIKNASIKDALKQIEKQSEFIFFYHEDAIDPNVKISVTAKSKTVEEVLDQLFEKTGNTYTISDRQIYISKTTDTGSKQIQEPQQSDTKTITGVVYDNDMEPLIGATVQIQNTTNAILTDIDGKYKLSGVKTNDVLLISFVGFLSESKKVGSQTTINIRLIEDAQTLGEIQVVAFATQKKESVVSSITTIAPGELKVPSSNLTTAIAGRMAGVIGYQRSGEPGADDADFFIRGITTFGYNQNPLILIDNIELTTKDLARLNTDDIESFSIMKDATATALYGARGANGVIYVKTKEGQRGKAKFNVRIENSTSAATKQIELADPITTMRLHNEAIMTRDPARALMYSRDKIDKTVPGSGSMIYPYTDWKKELLRNSTMNQRVNMNISGGGEVARYYVAASFSQDNGILKNDKNSNFNNNIDLKKYTLRSNVNIDVTKTTELLVRLSAAFDDYKGPLTSGTTLYNMVMQTSPTLFPAKYPVDAEHQFVQHTMFGNVEQAQYLNPYAEMVKGYKENSRSNIGAQVELKQNLKFVTEGLKARALMNVARTSEYDNSRAYKPFYYNLSSYDQYAGAYQIDVINPTEGEEFLTFSPGAKQITSNSYMEGAITYDREFNAHGISGLLVGQLNNRSYPNSTTLFESLPFRNVGLSGRFTYAFDSKYFSEFNFGYNGSERFDKNHRWGFFPSVGAGWLISKENFFKPLSKAVTMMKFRVSYGLVGNDKIGEGRFIYLSDVNLNDSGKGAIFGYDFGYNKNGVTVKRYGDPNITWEESTKTNYALEVELWKDLNIIAEYYTEKRKNILQKRESIPSTMGLGIDNANRPFANIGKTKGHGVDISLNYNKNINPRFWIQSRVNFTYATSEIVQKEQLHWDEYWKDQVGYHSNQQWGYVSDGLFIDDADVINSPQQFGDYKAGDIKYRDVNKDGVITEADMVPIGYPTTPEITYGFGATLGYKAFDFSFFFQGLGNESFWLDYNSLSPFFGGQNTDAKKTKINSLSQYIANSHWSEDNRDPYAKWPRLSDQSINNNNQRNTWFMRNGSFLRLKQVELGYTVPPQLLTKAGIKNLRVYVSGVNLLVFSKFKEWDVEMAGNGMGYPVQRVFNIGLNLNF